MGKDNELLEAARSGNISVVEKILFTKAKRSGPLASLRRGPGVNVQDSCGYSALHHAALNGHTEIVALLLTHDASPNLPDSRGSSPLHLASWAGHYDIVKLLLTNSYRPANPNLQTIDKETPLHCAAQHGHTECLTLLLVHGADPNVPNSKGETPLDLAAQYGRWEVVQILLNGHPELLLPFKYGRTVNHSPLHLASRNGHKSIVEILLAAGVDVNLQTPSGTALHEAALCGKDGVVITLLEAGANLDAVDCEGRTVIDLLEQFPPHVTRGIVSVINIHRKLSSASHNYSNDDYRNQLSNSYDEGQYHHRQRHRNNYHHYQNNSNNVWEPNTRLINSDYNKDFFNSTIKSKSFSSSEGPNSYMQMTPIMDQSKGHTPPKKPPRRNFSLSPTYLQDNTLMSMSFDCVDDKHIQNRRDNVKSAYEYLYLSHSGGGGHQDKKLSPNNHDTKDQYVLMSSPQYNTINSSTGSPAFYENFTTGMRVLNPNRKLKRNKNRTYEEFTLGNKAKTTVSYIVVNEETKEKENSYIPMSPTNYIQPPTPEHPPPTPIQAETIIHDVIRPLSQEYKRRSKEVVESGTSPPENLCTSLGASSASLSSSISLSDRSVSTDCVEEYVGDAPFAGLLKGSTTALQNTAEIPNGIGYLKSRLERPKTLKTSTTSTGINDSNDMNRISILSPFDEEEEWAKISEIMASFGEGLCLDADKDEVDTTGGELKGESNVKRNVIRSDIQMRIRRWLTSNGIEHLENLLIENGYDDINFIHGILNEEICESLDVIENDVPILLKAIKQLPQPPTLAQATTTEIEVSATDKEKKEQTAKEIGLNNNLPETIDEWLKTLKFECYAETFKRHLYTDMEKIFRIWEVELQAVLEINKIGHRKRILYSIYGDISSKNSEHSKMSSSIEKLIETKEENVQNCVVNISNNQRNIIRKKNRPAPKPPMRMPNLRAPSELLLGFPSGLKTQWRHSADKFITSFVKYNAFYLGSTVVKELRGTESTRKSIQKLKRGGDRLANTNSLISSKRPISFAISFCGVQFIDNDTEAMICEHEMKNIDCACQDADDLTHFAYITKDIDTHYCHVFNAESMDLATEIILTLGQAFEVAYQIALRDMSPSTPQHLNTESNDEPRGTRTKSLIV